MEPLAAFWLRFPGLRRKRLHPGYNAVKMKTFPLGRRV